MTDSGGTVRTRAPLLFVAIVALTVMLCGSAAVPTAHASAGGAATTAEATAAAPALTSDLSRFQPGNIISDAVFFNSGSMSESQIQAFLEAKVPVCQSGYTCLKNKVDSSTNRAADAMCAGYTGAANEPASRIIYRVAQACGINPQVILVTLQKEQGLVTHTWPSDWRYTIAMGQGCPDTAACDTRYYGFFNQVYGAAWQFKRYANPPGTSAYFTWYAPGRTWNVLYHPNAGCGRSSVYIENQATANLYYYTPYQPNAAALAAGYGTGDGCSSYGNRNFYNYFTDWFGSTTGGTVTLAKTATSGTVWIVASGSRWALADAYEWGELNNVFGPTYTVSQSFLDGLVGRGIGSNVVRDPTTGSMGVVDGGLMWGLASCTAVAEWGGSCANTIDLSPSLYRRVPVGPVISEYLQIHGSTRWGRLESGAIRLLYDGASAAKLNGGTAPAAPRMSPRVLDAKTKTAVYFAPGELVRTTSSATVYVTDGYSKLIPIPSFNTVREMGADPAAVRVVADAELRSYPARGDTLAPLAVCGSTTYFPAGGTLHPLSDPAATGLTATTLAAETCSVMRLATTPLSEVLVKSATNASVYWVTKGGKRALTSWAEAVSLGGANPTILTVAEQWLTSVPTIVPPPRDGTLVKGSSPSVYLKSGGTLFGVPSFSVTRELGFGTSFVQASDADLAAMGTAGPTLGLWVVCDGVTYFGASGVLHRVTANASFSSTSLSAEACAPLNRTGVAVQKVFVKSSTGSTVYLAEAGSYHPIGSWGRLLAEAGGVTPTILTVADATLATLPIGAVLQ